ncbi:MAG: PAS domain S-box protein, partial [Flavitalea sp.]
MTPSNGTVTSSNIPEFLTGGGLMGKLIREYDWTQTPLGPVDTWPFSLRNCLRIMLTSRQPIWVAWGKELITFYNDAYIDILGGKHGSALAQPLNKIWQEIWFDVDPLMTRVLNHKEGVYVESQLFVIHRNGYSEETYYTFSFTPIINNEGNPEGVICFNTEDTSLIINERQLKTVTELSKRLTHCETADEIFTKTIEALSLNPFDFPYVFFRSVYDQNATITHSSENVPGSGIPEVIDLSDGSDFSINTLNAIETGSHLVYENPAMKTGNIPVGPWKDVSEKMLILPILKNTPTDPSSMLVLGLNPYRLLDEKFMDFCQLIRNQVINSFADIRIKKSRALAQKNLESIFRNAPLSITIKRGIPARFELVNEEALKQWNKKPEEVIGKTLTEVFPELEGQPYAKLVDDIIIKGKRFSIEEQPINIHDNGGLKRRYYNFVAEPLLEEEGIEKGLMTIGIDVTDAVLSRQKIEESELYFRKMADSVPAIIWITDENGYCTYLNESWYNTTGQTKEEAEGLGWLKATHPDDMQESADIFLDALKEQKQFYIIYRLRQKDGSYRWSIDNGSVWYNEKGEFAGHIGSVIDVHEQKMAEELIKESEEQFREMANSVPQLVWIAQPSGEVTYYNERITEFSGATQTEDGSWLWNQLVHPEDIQQTIHEWEKATTMGSVYQIEHRIQMKDGSFRWFLSRAIPHKSANGSILKWFGAATDINTAKEYAQILEEDVKKRTSELKVINTSLERSNNELQQFAHVASHDLKEPLRKIKIFSDRLSLDQSSKLSSQAVLFLEKINNAADRMHSMIE